MVIMRGSVTIAGSARTNGRFPHVGYVCGHSGRDRRLCERKDTAGGDSGQCRRRISAAVPGNELSPAFFSSMRNSSTEIFNVRLP